MTVLTDAELIREIERRFSDYHEKLKAAREVQPTAVLMHAPIDDEAVKNEFITNIRNEVFNPLSSILGLAEQLGTGRSRDAGTLREAARSIYLEAFRLDLQLRTVVTAAELESGDTDLHFADLDLQSFFKSLLAEFRTAMDRKGLDCEFDSAIEPAPESGVFFRTDPEKLHLVLSALLSNAVEYSPAGGRIEVAAWRKDGSLHVSVGDQGAGIGREQQWKIFNRFTQLEAGSKKAHGGLGLGLAVARDLIVLLGGTLSLTSEPNKGCLFRVDVPAQAGRGPIEPKATEGNAVFFARRS
jgi:signal transduction histidine kinase